MLARGPIISAYDPSTEKVLEGLMFNAMVGFNLMIIVVAHAC